MFYNISKCLRILDFVGCHTFGDECKKFGEENFILKRKKVL